MIKIINSKGSVNISAEVFTNIAGDAATKCFGVKGMAGKRDGSGLVQLLRRDVMSRGVSVSFHEDGTASITLHIIVNYGVNLVTLGGSIINEVSYKVREATGVGVRSVTVCVDSLAAE